jgi:hypothetical protein
MELPTGDVKAAVAGTSVRRHRVNGQTEVFLASIPELENQQSTYLRLTTRRGASLMKIFMI